MTERIKKSIKFNNSCNCLVDYNELEKANKYDRLIKKIKQEIKRHKVLVETSREEDYKLAHSMVADELEELLEESEV